MTATPAIRQWPARASSFGPANFYFHPYNPQHFIAKRAKNCYIARNMNIEQLNKSQIVLLTLLVSFVTSIATGIVTVSLMDQAPPVVAQTVNRIVERTIETVAPANQTAAAATTCTVVVKETDLISQAVAQISPSIVRLYASTSPDSPFLGLGIVLSADGTVVSDASIFGEASDGAIGLSDGTRMKVLVSSRDDATGLIFLQATSTDSVVTWKPATIKSGNPILGQTVVLLSGKSIARVENGIVTALIPMGDSNLTEAAVIDTSISSDSIVAGSPLVNTNGEIVGVSTSVARTSSTKGFIASSALVKQTDESTGSGSDNAQ